MRTIKVHVRFAKSNIMDEFEVKNDLSNEEISIIVKERIWDMLDINWFVEKRKEKTNGWNFFNNWWKR